MMATFCFRTSALVGISLVLGACAQLYIDSELHIDDGYLTEEVKEMLVERVYEKAAELGGECKLLSGERQYHTCPVPEFNPDLEISIGYNQRGSYRISAVSTSSHIFPKRREDDIPERLISQTQRDLESWMRSLVPDWAVMRAERSSRGSNKVIHQF